MNRKLSLFLIVSLLSVQMFSFAHMAEHNFEKHEHNGQICDLYLFSEHTKYSGADNVTALTVPVHESFNISIFDQPYLALQQRGQVHPRAPPVLS